MASTSYMQNEENINDKKDLNDKSESFNADRSRDFVPDLFSWIMPDDQMKRAKDIAKNVK